MPWPPYVDDDGSGMTGTVTDAAFFDAIKHYIDDTIAAVAGTPAWIDLPTTGVLYDDRAQPMPATFYLNRYKRLDATTIVWQFTANPITLAAASTQIYIQNQPFQFGNLSWATPVAYAPSQAHLGVLNPAIAIAARDDGQPWAAGSGWLYFIATLEVVAG